ncbi:hypothetical protein LPN03_14990 [Arthrobacter sp. A2-55]|nr:hypothetical protein [Arthrobacter sp. A2-55]
MISHEIYTQMNLGVIPQASMQAVGPLLWIATVFCALGAMFLGVLAFGPDRGKKGKLQKRNARRVFPLAIGITLLEVAKIILTIKGQY